MYTVTQTFENAIEVWDGETKDDEKKPTGHMMIFVGADHPFTVGDEVSLVIRQISSSIDRQVMNIIYDKNCPPGQLFGLNLKYMRSENEMLADILQEHNLDMKHKRAYGAFRELPEEYPR